MLLDVIDDDDVLSLWAMMMSSAVAIDVSQAGEA